MNPEIRRQLMDSVQNVHLPRYHEIPDVGLFLEQVTKYVNGFLSTCGISPITSSMVSNYVKQKIIPGPNKKSYDSVSIAYLIFVAVMKGVMAMDDIRLLIDIQKRTYDQVVAYNYFCDEFENLIQYVFGNRKELLEVGVDHSEEKELLRVALCSIAQKIYLDHYLRILREEQS